MATYSAFLPPHLIRSLARRKHLPTPGTADELRGAFLLTDISGFTRLAERLQKRGREGAEEIAQIVNRVFRPAIRTIAARGGSIVSFGGDSLFTLFPWDDSVQHALATAREIQATVEDLREIDGRPLRVSQAIHHGTVRGHHLGSGDHRQYLMTGAPLRTLAALEQRAESGQLLLTQAAKRQLRRERSSKTRTSHPGRVPMELRRSYLQPALRPLLERFPGEYRSVALLFLQTRGSARKALNTFYDRLTEVLSTYGGVMLKTDLAPDGTNWLCVFGIPRAHEEDPERAAEAALELLPRLPRGIEARGGVHSGTVVNLMIGSRLRRSFDIMGDVVNTAARVMTRARWGEVLVTVETRHRLSGFETKRRGRHKVKGKGRRLELHALLRRTASTPRPLHLASPMVGRDRDLRLVTEVLGRAKRGSGSIHAIIGEAGVGKSRLKWEAIQAARKLGFSVHEGSCVSFGGTERRGIGRLLRDTLGLPDDAARPRVLSRLRRSSLGLSDFERHHLAELLGLRFDDSPLRHLDDRSIRLNNRQAFLAWCQSLARQAPQLLVLEDMHWADETTCDAVEWLAAEVAQSRVLVLLLSRPDYTPPREAITTRLKELPPKSVRELLRAHLGEVPEEAAELIQDQTGGNPFYVEELIRHLVESGIVALTRDGCRIPGGLETGEIPGSIEALVAARLDRLTPEGRRAAQLGAVIGRTFPLSLLRHLDQTGAAAGVKELVARDFVTKTADRPATYSFRNALSRDVAYSNILARRRRRLHRAVAEEIESRLTGQDDSRDLPVRGHHWEQAGLVRRARQCYLAAARQAATRSARDEPERLFRAYLGLVGRTAPESVEARLDLGEVLMRRGRMDEARTELHRTLDEARSLRARRIEAGALRSLGTLAWSRGSIDEARQLIAESLRIDRRIGHSRGVALALHNLAVLLQEQGRDEEMRASLEEALQLLRKVGDRRSEATMLGNLASIDETECPRRALRGLARAIRLAREVGDRQAEGLYLGHLGNINYDLGRRDLGRRQIGRALRIARDIGDRRFEGWRLSNLAHCALEAGSREEALQLANEAIRCLRMVGDPWGESVASAMLADIHLESGRIQAARATLAYALRAARRVGQATLLGQILTGLARLYRLTNNPTRAASRAAAAARILTRPDQKPTLVACLCEQGHVELDLGHDAESRLKQARSLADQLGYGPDSGLEQYVDALRRAQDARSAGAELLHGACPEDLPEALRKATHRKLRR